MPPDPLDPEVEHICRPSEGTGFLYGIGLHNAKAMYDWTTPIDGTLDKTDRKKAIKDHIPDYPVAYFGGTDIGLVGVGANAIKLSPSGSACSWDGSVLASWT